jgi:hypothetical protein
LSLTASLVPWTVEADCLLPAEASRPQDGPMATQRKTSSVNGSSMYPVQDR